MAMSSWQGGRPSWWNEWPSDFGGSHNMGFDDPFLRDMNNMSMMPSSFFNRSMSMMPMMSGGGMGGMGDMARLGALDIHETDSSHVFKVDVPGLSGNDVKVQVKDGNLLTISGSRERSQEDKDENRHYYRQERSYGSFNRSFRLPDNADAKGISANVDQGVLTVMVPKAYKSNSSNIPIGGGMQGMGMGSGNNMGSNTGYNSNTNNMGSSMGSTNNSMGMPMQSNSYSDPNSMGSNNNTSNTGTNAKSTNMGGGLGTGINVTSNPQSSTYAK